MPLDAESKRALAARINFYKELGIHSFYRRGDAPIAVAEPEIEPARSAAADPLPIINNPADKATALREVREDIGECDRCRLGKGRKNLVFGVGNINADIMFVGEGPGADEDE